MARISDILAFLEQVKQPNAQEVGQNAGVSRRTEDWLQSLGRHARRSVSPREDAPVLSA